MPSEMRLVDEADGGRDARDRFAPGQAQRSCRYPDTHEVGMRCRPDLAAKGADQLERRLRGDDRQVDQPDAQRVVVPDMLDRRSHGRREFLLRSNRRRRIGPGVQFAILQLPALC